MTNRFLVSFLVTRARRGLAAGVAVGLLWGAAGVAVAQAQQDPTAMGAPLASALQSALQDGSGVELVALVAAAGSDNGVALVRLQGAESPVLVRKGASVGVVQNGIPMRLQVEGVGAKGIELASGSLQEPVVIQPAVRAAAAVETAEAHAPDGSPRLALVEFNGVPLDTALRLLADQTGLNYTASPEAALTAVTLCLRNVSAGDVLDQLCAAHRLWQPPRDNPGAPARIQTLAEFEASLSSVQQGEQLSKVYTLLYPNVTEVASVIYGLYRDRVRLYLGDEDILDDDLNDLSRRFDRLNMLSSGTSELVEGFTSGNAGGGGGGGSGTVFSQDGDGQWRRLSPDEAALARGSGPIRKLDAAEAKLIAGAAAEAAGSTNAASGASLLADARLVPPAIFVTVARRSNMLILRCIDPRIMADLDALIRRLDVPSPMVLLDVKVMEVSLDDGLETIFDFSGEDDFTYHHGERTGTQKWSFPASSLLEKGLTFELITEKLATRVQLLQERGRAKVVATPSLLTVNNEASQLFMGKEVPIVRNVSSTTYMSGENVVSVPTTEFEFQRVGTSLLITPNVNANGTVTLRLLEENSEISATKGSIPIYTDGGTLQYFDVDVVESRSIAGTFVAQDRQTIAIGGLVREETADRRSGIPLLMDIPLLGWFFRSTQQVTTRNELVVFLTPFVMQSAADALGATQSHAERNLQFDDTRRESSVAPLEKSAQ